MLSLGRYSNGVVHSSTTPELRPYDLIFCVGDKEYIDGACTLDVAAVIADASPDKRFLKVQDTRVFAKDWPARFKSFTEMHLAFEVEHSFGYSSVTKHMHCMCDKAPAKAR